MSETRGGFPERPLVGRLLTHYEILGEIGRGGMGVVYRAGDKELGRELRSRSTTASLLE